KGVRASNCLNARQSLQTRYDLVEELYALRDLWPVKIGQLQIYGEHVLSLKSGMDRKHAKHAASEQPGADQQSKCDCNLAGNNDAAATLATKGRHLCAPSC